MRKTSIVTIAPPEAGGKVNRDQGKTFLVTEMPALAAEKWATKALLALMRAGVDVPEEAVQAGALAILAAGAAGFGKMAYEDAEPLLDEMLACAQIIPDMARVDPLSSQPVSRPMIDGDVEEVTTLVRLRSEVFEINLGFSVAAALSMLAAGMISKRPPIPTSRKRSAQSSGAGSRRSTSSKPSTA